MIETALHAKGAFEVVEMEVHGHKVVLVVLLHAIQTCAGILPPQEFTMEFWMQSAHKQFSKSALQMVEVQAILCSEKLFTVLCWLDGRYAWAPLEAAMPQQVGQVLGWIEELFNFHVMQANKAQKPFTMYVRPPDKLAAHESIIKKWWRQNPLFSKIVADPEEMVVSKINSEQTKILSGIYGYYQSLIQKGGYLENAWWDKPTHGKTTREGEGGILGVSKEKACIGSDRAILKVFGMHPRHQGGQCNMGMSKAMEMQSTQWGFQGVLGVVNLMGVIWSTIIVLSTWTFTTSAMVLSIAVQYWTNSSNPDKLPHKNEGDKGLTYVRPLGPIALMPAMVHDWCLALEDSMATIATPPNIKSFNVSYTIANSSFYALSVCAC
ncbi:hypothetical protein OG21DRAFT_1525439 [Imleria badia]|nr:hypothetical protein OG21DRAFT_1525439 [Imleria badia]